MLRRAFGFLAASRLVAQLLFDVKLPSREPGERYFDTTTLALRGAAATHVSSSDRICDAGCGSFALLGLWLAQRSAHVVCTEIDPAIAARADATVRLNGADVEVRVAPLFGDGSERFDVILFNPPYVPTATGEARALPESHRTQWDGGPDGAATIREFLAALAERSHGATALLGVSRRHVPRARMEALVREAGLHARELLPYRRLQVDVWVLTQR